MNCRIASFSAFVTIFLVQGLRVDGQQYLSPPCHGTTQYCSMAMTKQCFSDDSCLCCFAGTLDPSCSAATWSSCCRGSTTNKCPATTCPGMPWECSGHGICEGGCASCDTPGFCLCGQQKCSCSGDWTGPDCGQQQVCGVPLPSECTMDPDCLGFNCFLDLQMPPLPSLTFRVHLDYCVKPMVLSGSITASSFGTKTFTHSMADNRIDLYPIIGIPGYIRIVITDETSADAIVGYMVFGVPIVGDIGPQLNFRFPIHGSCPGTASTNAVWIAATVIWAFIAGLAGFLAFRTMKRSKPGPVEVLSVNTTASINIDSGSTATYEPLIGDEATRSDAPPKPSALPAHADSGSAAQAKSACCKCFGYCTACCSNCLTICGVFGPFIVALALVAAPQEQIRSQDIPAAFAGGIATLAMMLGIAGFTSGACRCKCAGPDRTHPWVLYWRFLYWFTYAMIIVVGIVVFSQAQQHQLADTAVRQHCEIMGFAAAPIMLIVAFVHHCTTASTHTTGR